MQSDYEAIRRQSFHWIRNAGRIARERFGRAVTLRKADDSPVTDADHAVQASLLAAIAARYPQDAVITEETQVDPARHMSVEHAKRCWVIDPIDGTRNYARSVPLYCLSVALMEAGVPVVGVIYNPTTGEMFSASTGGGAWLDDRRLPLPARGETLEKIIACPSDQRTPLAPLLPAGLAKLKLRTTGSTALHLAYLASGGFDAVIYTDCHLWDIAAGWLICKEAGMVAKKFDGTEPFPLDLARAANQTISMFAASATLFSQLWSGVQPSTRS